MGYKKMDILTAAWTDVGIRKALNEDSYCMKAAQTGIGTVVMAAVCDGMGGLDKGEVASASVIEAFSRWFEGELPFLMETLSVEKIEQCWRRIIEEQNRAICSYGKEHGIQLGTTLTVLLVLGEYAVVAGHVGDSRLYKINEGMSILTEDHTLVNRELKNGRMTPEEARADTRRNVLLQCIGAQGSVQPDFIIEKAERNTTYMLCSDGFRHELSEREIYEGLHPEGLTDEKKMLEQARVLVELNKKRMEQDNITVLLLKTV